MPLIDIARWIATLLACMAALATTPATAHQLAGHAPVAAADAAERAHARVVNPADAAAPAHAAATVSSGCPGHSPLHCCCASLPIAPPASSNHALPGVPFAVIPVPRAPDVVAYRPVVVAAERPRAAGGIGARAPPPVLA